MTNIKISLMVWDGVHLVNLSTNIHGISVATQDAERVLVFKSVIIYRLTE